MINKLMVETAPGELVDKITILEIKSERISDPEKLKNVMVELEILKKALEENVPASEKLTTLCKSLASVNLELWIIEDDIRDCERAKDFGPEFVRLARAVYVTNDRRASLKKEINLLVGSAIVEEKSYAAY